jgi:hypothetical protein
MEIENEIHFLDAAVNIKLTYCTIAGMPVRYNHITKLFVIDGAFYTYNALDAAQYIFENHLIRRIDRN